MSNVCAGIGRGQMIVLPKRIAQRRYNFDFYKQALAGIKGIRFIADPGNDYYSNHWLTTILIDSNEFSIIDIQDALLEDNIDCRPLWKPMHLQPVFKTARYYGDGVSERLFEKGLCLPSGSNLTDVELTRVVSRIREVVNVKKSSKNIANNPISCVTFALISVLLSIIL
jgi:dTDP-4-amino-4,6-dideoxygalactose transaminase